ncbi:LysR family transcriptional regulator [Aliiglaciecola sp. SL4]|uniref:LysR family transcriptional regulator n=1 Tax=Aliiglaciecola sp. SL4 TaxID=3239806 RepID=UPI00355C28C6
MDIRHLKHFAGIAKYGSFSEAAKRLYISQPALTRSINVLEDILGTRLFERTPRGVYLTETGTMLHRHAMLILNEMEAARDELRAVLEGSQGEIHVGAASMFSNLFLDKAAANLSQNHQGIHTSITIGLYEDLVQQLLDGVLDVVLSTSPDSEYRDELLFEPLCEINSVIVASSSHPLSAKDKVEVSDLMDVSWVVLKQAHMDSFMHSFFADEGLPAPHSKVRSNSLNIIHSMVQHDGFIGILPSHWVQESVEKGDLKILPVPGTPIRRKAGLITRKVDSKNIAAGLLMEEIRSICQQLP